MKNNSNSGKNEIDKIFNKGGVEIKFPTNLKFSKNKIYCFCLKIKDDQYEAIYYLESYNISDFWNNNKENQEENVSICILSDSGNPRIKIIFGMEYLLN